MHLARFRDRKSTRLNSSHTVIYTLSLHDALPIFFYAHGKVPVNQSLSKSEKPQLARRHDQLHASCTISRSEEHTSELQSHSDLHSFPTRRSSDLFLCPWESAGKSVA